MLAFNQVNMSYALKFFANAFDIVKPPPLQ